jgi:hypothetical protein
MASVWKDSRTPYYVACFTAIVGPRRAQWKRSTFVLTKGIELGETRANRKLAERIARGRWRKPHRDGASQMK